MKDLSITAKYTGQCWVFGKFEGAELLATEETKQIFDGTNAVLDLTSGKSQPSLPHSLVQRHAMIDRLLSDWLRQRGGEGQVLELAAGLSARGVRFTKDPLVTYTEVDLPSVLGKKRELLARTSEGQDASLRSNLRYVSGDLAHLELSALVDTTQPVFVISEGLCMYLDAEALTRLWQRINALFAQAGSEYVFDLVPFCEESASSRAGRVLDFGLRLMTGGRTFAKDGRTRAELSTALLEAGFDSVATHDPKGKLDHWNLPHTRVPTQQLIFHACGGELGATNS
ncbi:MAG: class I SAM-dependent methyltransferase [Planctomycetota bacterium]|nr:class I SAM-dependent methyltransferase [Planctomycetota bacterium]